MLYNTQNPHGGEVYSHPVSLDFSANINPLGTPEAVQQAVINSLPLLDEEGNLVYMVFRKDYDSHKENINCGKGGSRGWPRSPAACRGQCRHG